MVVSDLAALMRVKMKEIVFKEFKPGSRRASIVSDSKLDNMKKDKRKSRLVSLL